MIFSILVVSKVAVSQEDPKVSKQINELWPAQRSADSTFYKQRAAMEGEYRKKLAQIIAQADTAEVFLLDFAMPEVESSAVTGVETFPIEPYSKDTRIIKKLTLKDAELAALKKVVSKVLSEKEGDGGVLCHYPIHGIKLFNGAGMIFETSLCWHCANYWVKYPDSCHFHTMGNGFGDLKTLLEKLLPIPQSERDRFKASTSGLK
jgi:hypothetical protein